jgi:thiamine transporter
MKDWFVHFAENLGKVTLSNWLLVALFIVTAIALILLLKKRSGVKLTALVWLIAIGAIVAVVLTASPALQLEEGVGNTFLYSPVFWSLIIAIGGIAAMLLLLRKQVFTTRMLSAGALCVALAFLLSFLTLWRLPQGGSITPASMLPLFIYAYLFGAVPGVAAGTVYGVLQLIQGPYIVHPVQFLTDYILPFAILGLAGLFRKDRQLWIGVLFASFLRFAIHTVSGVVFFAMYAPPDQNVWIYSSLYNGTYMLPEMLICLIIVLFPQVDRALALLRPKLEP